MSKRIYVLKIIEDWQIADNLHFKLFANTNDKNYVLDYGLKWCTQIYLNSNYKYNDNYTIRINIFEMAKERYMFGYADGVVNHFNNIIQEKCPDIYDKLLQCFDFVYYIYDINGELLEMDYLYPRCAEGISSYGKPILEEECVDGIYTGDFKYSLGLGRKLKSSKFYKKSINDTSCIYTHIEFVDKSINIFENDKFQIIDGNIEDALINAKQNIIEIIKYFNTNFNKITDFIKDFYIEIYYLGLDEDEFQKVFTTNNINDILKEE